MSEGGTHQPIEPGPKKGGARAPEVWCPGTRRMVPGPKRVGARALEGWCQGPGRGRLKRCKV